jgi:glucose uptake protein
MFVVNDYLLAVILCVVTMICWGSWGNTQKLAAKTWRYELFYWDYVIGILLLSLIFGFTLGSMGDQGRGFTDDIAQASSKNFWNAFTGGIVFNASNILLAASISMAGMSVAFPVGVGLALVLGVFINYFGAPKGDPVILFLGVALIVIAIVMNGVASGKMSKGTEESKTKKKGIIIAICAGFLMSFFYRFVASAMDLNNLENPMQGMLTPYGAFFIFSLGILGSNFIFNTLAMKRPFMGKPVNYSQYFKGSFNTHMVGILGGIIWGVGTAFSYIAAGKAGPAISYALGQGAPMIAALWGVFIWKEFRGSPKVVNYMLAFMFILFIAGLSLIVASGSN